MEDEEKAGWFHCGRCGAFFGAEIGGGVPERCPDCGSDPVVETAEVRGAELGVAPVASGVGTDDSRQSEGGARRRGKSKHKKGRNGLAIFIGIWLAVLAILAGAVKYFQGSDEGGDDQLGFGILTEDDRLVVDQYHECRRKVVFYLEAGVPESRVEFVLNPAETLARMSERQRDLAYSGEGVSPQELVYGLIETPKGKAIESVWEIDGGRKVEAVFFLDGKEWKFDWANMVRYSEQEWPLFLLGNGDSEGEFRLLARRRSEVADGAGGVGSVVLIAPRAGFPGELGATSPEVPVEPDSRVGRSLEEAFRMRDADEGIYGSQSAEMDPNGMIRLRAKIVRGEGSDGERSFVIREILACHWYEIDDLGLSE